MIRLLHYYGRFQGLRSEWGGLPPWARLVLFIFALPGILLILLSILAVLVSLAALLLLTVPVYRILRAVTGGASAGQTGLEAPPPSPRRHVDVTIID